MLHFGHRKHRNKIARNKQQNSALHFQLCPLITSFSFCTTTTKNASAIAMSAVWIYAVSKVSFGPCLLSAAPAVPGLQPPFLPQKGSRSAMVSPCGGRQSSGPLSEKFTAYLLVKFQLSLGRCLLGEHPKQP